MGSSSTRKMARVMGESSVWMYRASACTLRSLSREPNWPLGCRRLMLFVPTCSCAMKTTVEIKEASPCR